MIVLENVVGWWLALMGLLMAVSIIARDRGIDCVF